MTIVYSYKLKICFAILFLCLVSNIFAQNHKVDSLSNLLNTTTNNYERAKINLQLAKLYESIDFEKGKIYANNALRLSSNDSLSAEASSQLGRFYYFTGKLDSASYYFEKAKQILSSLNDERRVAMNNISIGAIQLSKGEYNNTIQTLTESASFFEESGDNLNAAKCYTNISTALAELGNYAQAIEYNEKALQIFNENNLTQFKLITLPNLAAQHFKNGDTLKAINYNLEAEKLATEMGNKRSLSIILNNLGSIYLDTDPKKARNYLERTIQLKNELNLKSGIEVAEGNLGYLYMKEKDFASAIYYYMQVEQKVNGKQLVFAYNQLTECYKNINQYEKAYEYSEKARLLNDSLLNAESQKVFNEIQTQYETEKKGKEILELKAENLAVDIKRSRNQNLLFITLGILAVTILMVVFLLKNSKKKRLLIQQKLKIKDQEFIQQLKIQELNGIDAIIDAQEQERIRIADDLHDNLGSKIATLKLYINEAVDSEDLKQEDKTELNQKLKSLADDTYKEVRKIAHNKIFGALINEGLIPSIKIIAGQISSTNKIKVEVVNINVNRHIKNNIEIQIFRIIQELLTNVIKHSKATEVVIQFSEDEDVLDVMIEDNGKGFNTKDVKLGMGLTNIEKRMDKIDGDFVLDSSPGNGTTVVLNIPF